MPMTAPPPGPLDQFHARLEEVAPEPASLQPLLRELEAEGLLETALGLLKRRHPRSSQEKGRGWGAVRVRMETTVARNRETRMANWQMDPQRRQLRLLLEVCGAATQLNPAALVGTLARAFQAAGLPLAMGLEKHPRPLLVLGHPLPLGVPGAGEWADVALRAPLDFPLEELPGRLALHLPPGLSLREAREVPVISSPVAELCVEARWMWVCPEALLPLAKPRLEAFAAAPRWEIEKSGKQEGQKVMKRTDVRPLVLRLGWEGPRFAFTTRLQAGGGTSPVKLLAGILGCPPAEISGLSRESLVLAPDPRLQNAYRYETKLSNLWEDAVLLDCGPGPLRVDEDDDSPLVLH